MEKENGVTYGFKKNEVSNTKQKKSIIEILENNKRKIAGIIGVTLLLAIGSLKLQEVDMTPPIIYKNNDIVLYQLFNLNSDERLVDLEEKIFNESIANNNNNHIELKIANDKMLVLDLNNKYQLYMKIQYVDLPINSIMKTRNYSLTYYNLPKNTADSLEKKLDQYAYANMKLKVLKYKNEEDNFYNVSVTTEQKIVSMKELEKILSPELPPISESPNFPPISLEELDKIIKNKKFWDALPNPELISKDKNIKIQPELPFDFDKTIRN